MYCVIIIAGSQKSEENCFLNTVSQHAQSGIHIGLICFCINEKTSVFKMYEEINSWSDKVLPIFQTTNQFSCPSGRRVLVEWHKYSGTGGISSRVLFTQHDRNTRLLIHYLMNDASFIR